MEIGQTDALVVIDLQVDFCPGGALAVAGGGEIVPIVNRLLGRFPVRVLTQDWHPADHLSFAASHPGAAPFSEVELAYGPQVLWPVHCVIGTAGAGFHPALAVDRADLILRKGFRPAIDSYSAFRENDRRTKTGLESYLRERGTERVFFAGLALDYCVGWSAVDAALAGFQSFIIEDACRAIDPNRSLALARQRWSDAGVSVILDSCARDQAVTVP